MKQGIKATVIACLAITLTACLGTSPPSRFFGLLPITATPAASESSELMIGVGPIKVPEYLRRPQIVTRGAGNEFIVHEYDRWAERLDDAFPRLLATNIDILSPTLTAVAMPYEADIGVDYRLVGRVLRFDTDASGLAVLEIHWGFAKRGDRVETSTRARYTAQAADPSDPTSIVAALQQTLDACSRDLASTIQEAVAQGS